MPSSKLIATQSWIQTISAAKALLFLAAVGSLPACADDGRALSPDGGDSTNPIPASPRLCATPTEGCPCKSADQTVDCGEVERESSASVTCSVGIRSCDGKRWGTCQATGSQLLMQRPTSAAPTRSTAQRRLLAQSSPQSCASACDPFCWNVVDDVTGITDDPTDDVDLTTDGVTLIQTETPPNTPPCTGLTLTPSTSTLTVTQFSPVAPSTIQMTAALTPAGCYPGTPPVLWGIDRYDIATISSSGQVTLVSPIAGPLVVTGYSGSFTTTRTLTVVVDIDEASGAPCGSVSACRTAFTGTTSADTGTAVIYPYDNTVLPLGLLAPLVQWTAGSTGAASGGVKVTLRYPATGTLIFEWSQFAAENGLVYLDPPTNSLAAPNSPRFTIPQAVWFAFEQTVNRNRVASGDTARIALQRRTGTTRRTELTDPVSPRLKFASNQLRGTVYYQTYGTNFVKNYGRLTGVHQYRYECPAACLDAAGNLIAAPNGPCPTALRNTCRFGGATLSIRPGATYPSVVAGTEYDGANDGVSGGGGGCRVCHSASASGSTLVSGRSGSSTSALFNLNAAMPNYLGTNFSPDTQIHQWPAVYPDGTFMLAGSGPPSTNYGFAPTVPSPGLDGSAWILGSAPANSMRSLTGATPGADVTPSSMFPSASAGFRAVMPAFSPEGTRLAFNHYAGTATGIAAAGHKRDIALADFTPATKRFSNLRTLVDITEATACSATTFGGVTTTDPCTLVWPTFLPSSKGLVYGREIFNNGRVTNMIGETHADFGGTRGGCRPTTNNATIYIDTDPTRCYNNGSRADLWWSTLAATPQNAKLTNASGVVATGHLTTGTDNHDSTNEPLLSYEPTANPEQIGGYNWIAFTSRRLYGNLATANPWWSDPRSAPTLSRAPTKKIWISAINANPAGGADPSHPAFYLPGQEYLAGNTKAFWALSSCTAGSSTRSSANLCNSDLDCCSGSRCSLQTPIPSGQAPSRHCTPTTAFGSCLADNSPAECTSDAECCNVAAGSLCVSGTCQAPPPIQVYLPGTFTRDFEAACDAGKSPVWQLFQWQAELPTGTSIDFTAATALTTGALATAPTIDLGSADPPDTTSWEDSGINIEAALAAINEESLPFLRVTMDLQASSDGQAAPTLTDWRVIYDCVDSE